MVCVCIIGESDSMLLITMDGSLEHMSFLRNALSVGSECGCAYRRECGHTFFVALCPNAIMPQWIRNPKTVHAKQISLTNAIFLATHKHHVPKHAGKSPAQIPATGADANAKHRCPSSTNMCISVAFLIPEKHSRSLPLQCNSLECTRDPGP